jgi:predicted NAD/FAD-dependent oxidoreductase
LSHRRLRNAKEAAEVGADRIREIGLRAVRKRLTDEYAGVVYEAVYSAKLLDGFAYNSFTNLWTRNVADDSQDAWIAQRFNRSRGGNDAIIPISKSPH